MPKEIFSILDFSAVVVCFITFMLILYILSLIINYTLVLDDDDVTTFERFGSKRNFKFGKRPLQTVRYKINRYNQMIN